MTRHLMIMAAGTGGHIFPGIAIADTMRARGWKVSWLGTAHGMEQDLVPRHGIPMHSIDFAGLRGKGLLHSVKGVFKLVAGFFRCWGIFDQEQPDVVLGMGGYVTVPGGWAARVKRQPLALMNADASLLLSNKSLAPFAKRVMFGFPDGFGPDFSKGVVTGNPVRPEILAVPAPEQRFAGREGPLRVLVVGGSLGARALNQAMPAALALIPADRRPLVTHQSGKNNIEELRRGYQDAGVVANVLPFIDDMASAYAQTDLVICRAGAITVSELTAAGVASVLVPLVASTTSHQRDNANWMAKQQAGIHLPQTELTPQGLADLLQSLSREQCAAMAQRAHARGKRDANAAIAQQLEELVKFG